MHRTLLAFLLLSTTRKCLADEIWEQDLSENMHIGASTRKYDRVTLRCDSDKMTLKIKMVENFSGVIYTRGSFYSKESSCFSDPKRGKRFTMNIPFDKCKTEKENNKYSNVVVIQHDDEFVTPGDAAFTLECDFFTPKNIEKMTVDFTREHTKVQRSAIGLIDADPGRDKNQKLAYVESTDEEVVFVPKSFHEMNDEL
ncbi:hypothetical protein KPH14_005322 [Odynerus spinipes]|uniref:ZP domain-containing protein n=1 Tax=Odynerus spinipes TaxID=1348599 RepID=A0AAD9RBI3_9HYME|nr:hypothetical protein KPH14_005322 [Odynerus spinipes]